MQKAPRPVRVPAGWGRRCWEAGAVMALGVLLVPLTAALTAAEDGSAVAAMAAVAAGVVSPGSVQGAAPESPAAESAAPQIPAASSAKPTATPKPTPSPAPVRRIVGLGDSVPAGSACGCTDYVTLLGRGLGAQVTSTNLAVPGQTTSGLLDQLSSSDVRSALADADVVVVTIGANDVEGTDPSDCDTVDDGPKCYSDDLATLQANLDKVASSVASLATRPGARVVLTGYWNVFLDGSAAQARGASYQRVADAVTHEVNGQIKSAASAHGAVFVDLFTPFRGADGSKDCTPLLAADGDHPDAAGHELIARTLLAAL